MSDRDEYELSAARTKCLQSHLYFTRYFFKQRMGSKFIVNWHHQYISDLIDRVLSGEILNLVINVAPGSSKTEIVVINLIARGLALNNMARFLHLSYSDDLALLNSQTARDIIRSDEYQELWPMEIAQDTKAKGRWNIMVDGRKGGGCYATSLNGQITGFRAGHMAEGFQGAIIIDDPMKPEDAFSKTKLESANRRLLTTVKSRKAKPGTPIILIMQRISETDPTGFIESGGLQGKWTIVKIPALLSDEIVEKSVPEQYHGMINSQVRDDLGRFSYWEFKEPAHELEAMEKGAGVDEKGNPISRHVFNAQYQQSPVAMGGNIIKGKYFVRYTTLPAIKYRIITADTAQKTKEHNDYSVFQCWGMGADGKIYMLDQIRGKWESPELKRRARAFWAKHSALDIDAGLGLGNLREMIVEDKSSGTDLIQTLKFPEILNGTIIHAQIPIRGMERNKDKYLRIQDALPYIEMELVAVPETAPFTSDFVLECESFKADMTHAHDDQIDPMLDAVQELLSNQNILNLWANLGG